MLFGSKKLDPNCIMRIELMLCIPVRIIQYFFIKLASTYSPVPSPAKYHRPSVS